MDKLLQNFAPNEVLVSKKHKKEFQELFGSHLHSFFLEDWIFQEDYANESLNNHFKTQSLQGFGITHLQEGIIASGAVLHYLSETQHKRLHHINTIKRIADEDFVWMDRFTVRNLELYHSTNTNAITLLDVIDKTISPMGGRMLKRWLALPLKKAEKIKERHAIVAFLKTNESTLEKCTYWIKQMGDLERLISKVATGKINPKEVIQLKNSLEAVLPLKQLMVNSNNEALQALGNSLYGCDALRTKIKEMLNEEAPVTIGKGKTIADGYAAELDELRHYPILVKII